MTTQTVDAEGLIVHAVARGQPALSEYESKQVLAAYDIPVTQDILAQDAAGVERAAEELGYPVAVKGCGPTLMHKSDTGLVALNVDDVSSVQAAVARIAAAAGDTALDGYLVQRMVPGKREIIVGGLRDGLFGPCVMLGLGGILVEAVADVTFRLAPLGDRDALEMLHELRGRHVFDAVRGEPAVDRPALCGVLMAVGRILETHPQVSQVDINPLIIEGAQPVAVDALVTLDAG